MRARRAALGIAAVAAIALVAGAIALPRLVDPERVKHLAREKAAANLGRELSIGALTLELFPVPILHASEVALANPPWAKARNLATAQSVQARLALLPLLFGKTRVTALDLDGVRINLETGADGARSWDLGRPGSVSAKDAGVDGGPIDLTALTIRNADVIRRGKGSAISVLHIDEAQAEAHAGLRGVRVEATVQRHRKPLAVKASFDDLSGLGKDGATTAGHVDLDWGKTQLAIDGRLPIAPGMKGFALKADLKASSIQDMLAWLGETHLATAPVVAHLAAREADGKIELEEISARFGKTEATGALAFTRDGAKTRVGGRIEFSRVMWEKALADLGFPPLPVLSPEELFHDNPLAWPLLVGLDGTEGAIDLKIASLVLRNGVEMKNVKAHTVIAGDRLDLDPFAIETLGGSATGTLAFEGRRKAVRVKFEGEHLMLERWFRERGAKIPFNGGPMKVKATLTTSGDSMKALAGAITGPVTIRAGPGVWASEKAGHAEDVMASAFSSRSSSSIDFECIGARLPFVAGRASAKSLVGARSTVSNLLTSGFVDLRDETFELRGRVKPRSGHVGLAAIAGDIEISGKLREPKAHLDPVGTPAAIARGAAAILTLGLSAAGTAAAEADEARKSDPCELVFH